MLLRASSAPRWMKCAASVRFVPNRPEEESEAARLGTVAAGLADQCYKLGLSPESFLHQPDVDADMVFHISNYLDVLKGKRGGTEMPFKHPTMEIEGTSDFVGWSDDGKVLYITDLKYGYEIVDPDSYQLDVYLTLVLRHIQSIGETFPERVQLAIYQPRALHSLGPYRKRVLSIEEAWKVVTAVETRAMEILMGDDVGHPGRHCQNCLNAFSCGALTHSVYHMYETVSNRQQHDPTPYQLAGELEMLASMKIMLDARKEAVEAEAIVKIDRGTFIPGWTQEKRYGKRKFTVDADVIMMMTGIDPHDDKLVTPAELERRGADKAVVKTITETPFIGTKLEPSKSERQVADLFAAAQHGEKNV